MSNALLSDVEARAQRRRTHLRAEAWRELAERSWHRAKAAADPAEARRWLERAHRMLPQDGMVAITLASNLLAAGEWPRAAVLFQAIATQHGTPEAWAGLATCAHLLNDPERAHTALAEAVRQRVPDDALRALARATGQTLPPPPERRIEGFVQAEGGGILGWAWAPSDPGHAPALTVEGRSASMTVVAQQPAEGVADLPPLARPRRFAVPAAQVERLGSPLVIRGDDGRNLLGSPLDPLMETRPGFVPVWADAKGPSPAAPPRRRPVDVVIPVHGGRAVTLACIESVLGSGMRGARVIVVDDASPDPELAAALDRLARRRRIVLLRLSQNVGFPGAANAGLRAAAGRDAVLLNSDTLVPPGWLERLREAAYSAPDIGTVTPLTNDGTIVSYPDAEGGNPVPDLDGTIATDALAQRANGAATAELPVGVGFCLYLRRDCLDAVGALREDVFAQGYGEENDLCLRARHAGWRSVAALGVFVAHVGGASFGGARAHLVRRNSAILNRLHPGYDALVAAHVAADPLLPARQRMDAARWAAARRRGGGGAVVMVTHGGGGGVDRVIAARAAAARVAGHRPIVLRPWRSGAGAVGLAVQEPEGRAYPNLVFSVPDGLPALARLLRGDRAIRVEMHHALGHHAGVAAVPGLLRAPLVSVVHDYARFCGRIALVSTERRYCGEPPVEGCEACIADLGSLLEDDPPVRTLLARSAAELEAASVIVAPSTDAASRLARHFPGRRARVEPWEDDRRLPPLSPARRSGALKVVVVGAIGVEKGFEVLLGCARDAKARGLNVSFTVVGYTADDERLMGAGDVHVTGEYSDADAVGLIRAQGAQLAFIPSVWPETWCFALSRAWQAGLPAVVFDLGAQSERVKATGRGWVLPLGLSPSGVNDALLRLAPGLAAGQSPPGFHAA